MLKYSKGQKVSLNLTLINNDGSPEDNADVSYTLYDENNNQILSNSNVSFNSQLGSYIDVIDPLTDWTTQEAGLYYVQWNIDNTVEDYPNTAVEELYIELYDEKLDTIDNKIDDLDSTSSNLAELIQSESNDLSNQIDENTSNIIDKLDDLDSTSSDIIADLSEVNDKLNNLDNKANRILGLVHENIYIDDPEYDKYGNLIGANVTLYSNSSSVGTDENIIATYKIEAEGESHGKLVYWKQVEI